MFALRTAIGWFAAVVALSNHNLCAQLSFHARSMSVYHPRDVLDPATLMSQRNFADTSRRGYVVIEGYIDYVAGTLKNSTSTNIKTEDDGDFHFEMQTTPALRPPGESPEGLVCEIDPPWQLYGSDVLSQINRKNPATYRKVRVYGWLRFGTEANHSGTQTYNIGNGRQVLGHWEIHPVERIEAVDGHGSFSIGPGARVASWPTNRRYKVTNATFATRGPSNYAKLTGKVQHITASVDKSGDVDVWISIGSRRRFLATIPQYYISRFDAGAQTVTFLRLPNFAAIGYSLSPSDETTRIFYGLRDWRFRLGTTFPTLQPVEMIK
jgi:hypothetical protein